jgi:hypothetical protein
MKVWISKYALTQGIYERDVEQSKETPTMVTCQGKSFFTEYYHGEGKDWHLTRAGAVKKANEMREKAIASAEKKIAKLKKMVF